MTEEAALDLWAYIDARDAARAFLLAANAQTPGHERFFISAGDSYSETPTADLLAARYPGTQVRTSLEGHAYTKRLIACVPELGTGARFLDRVATLFAEDKKEVA